MQHKILVIGRPDDLESTPDWVTLLERSLVDIKTGWFPKAVEALAQLAQEPTGYAVAVIDVQTAGLPVEALVESIRQISPALEMVLVCPPQVTWESLALPLDRHPIVLAEPISAGTLISCVAKLLSMIEDRREHGLLRKNFNNLLSYSRKNAEAILALMNRPVGVGMISTRRDGFITFYDPIARRLTGYGQDELPHIRRWAEILLPEHGEARRILSRFEEVWSQGPSREETVLRIRHKDGRFLRLSLSFLVLQDDSGEPRQIVALMFDPKSWSESQACKMLLESSPLSYYSYHRQNGLELVTPGALELINRAFDLNLELGQVQGKMLQDLPLPEDMVELWAGWLEEYFEGGGKLPKLPPPLGLPGRRVLEHSHAAPRISEGGASVGVVALLHMREDLQAKTHQNAVLDQLFRVTLKSIPHPFMLLKAIRDQTGRVRDFQCLGFNRAAVDLLKMEGELREPLPLLGGIFPSGETMGRVFDLLVDATETGSEHTYESMLQLRPRDEHKSMVQFWIGKVGDGAALFFRDTTAKRAEEETLKQYRHIFAHMEESIVVTDQDGIITDWNPASERMYGYRKQEIIGRPTHILTSDKSGSPLQQEARDILRDGEVWKGEYRFNRQDGRPGVASTVLAVLKDDDGRPYGTVGLSHDVTDQKKMEERLKIRSQELQEKNVALNTLLRHAEEERLRACEQVASDMTGKITEGLTKIMGAKTNPELVDNLSRVLLQDLGQSVSARGPKDQDPLAALTEKELEVARLIRLGKTTEEIAFILEKSSDTVRLQRISIRKKLGLTRRDHNLREMLNQLEVF